MRRPIWAYHDSVAWADCSSVDRMPASMKRPQSVTVFGILNIVFGAIGIVGLVINLAAMNSEVAKSNPVFKIIEKEPVYRAFMEASVYAGAVVSLVLIVAGIGLLNLKSWARKLSIGYAIYGMAMTVVGGVLSYLYLLRPMLEDLEWW